MRAPRAVRGAHTIGTGPEHPAIGAESPDSTAIRPWSAAESSARVALLEPEATPPSSDLAKAKKIAAARQCLEPLLGSEVI
ncbi:hypothetical protein EMIHUDRAFT_222722 [Emiliania huxleyi CCMP1516]|uniref:Uncharacterized protein n=2 Tax=Emiliania huxleyi TaxID=2903 RepID=A0A0D3KXV9_EMIH1|nr:hypothetical protein EMIHUDRAFT_222722 [Emiliania huxleyi CCMP1516]EOD40594.1 hypothetical protein EMIHUDRAFT_222722 [Emiliania huxleyi CCMP1516]|eukprot:XP_005793023.1 hypothetical protein EMIHUDRAFT_222722 [Emiliania huxleyi CCMP1516]